ncbi:LOW QUALITY PROTEIN: uncharacterized protein ACR2FA_004944 [Aphomia sociella]
MKVNADILDVISKCFTPKLSKHFEHNESHAEFKTREDLLKSYFHVIIELLNGMDYAEFTPNILSSLLILNLDLLSVGPWYRETYKEFSTKLNNLFEVFYGFKLDSLMWHGDVINVQEVFDNCLEKLHLKLTYEDFKKFPALIEVYCSVIQDVQEYGVVVNPITTMPISLLLMDDYIVTNKIKGLKSCTTILKCLTVQNFQDGNYYEIIYGSLKKSILEKDIDVTKLTLQCFKQLLKILPHDVKANKMDDIFKVGLDQIYTEANLSRKAVWFSFITNIIEMQGVNCVNRKILKAILCDNINICCNEAVGEILLDDVLKCVEAWIKYCWCIWKLATDQKFLAILMKLLYTSCEDEQKASKIEILIMTLIDLCTKEEQKALYKNIEESCHQINKIEFVQRLEVIRRYLCIINLLIIQKYTFIICFFVKFHSLDIDFNSVLKLD